MHILCIIGLAFVGYSLDMDQEKLARQPALVRSMVQLVWENSFYYVSWFAAGTAILSQAHRLYGGDVKLWKVIQAMLDEYQVLTKPSGNYSDHDHKVTLFRHQSKVCLRGCLFWRHNFNSGWLVPVARSGRRNLRTPIYFHAPGHNPHRAEGVAGKVWQSGDGVRYVPNLPEVSIDSPDEILRAYAKETNVSIATLKSYLKRRGYAPRSYLAINVEVGGALWGVLVVDSRAPDLGDQRPLVKSFRSIAPNLDRVLQELYPPSTQ